MTDAPDGPAEGEPERGARRSPRVGDGGSPVGSTLSIVLALIAVVAGFLILRAITDDDDGGAGSITPPAGSTTEPLGTNLGQAPGDTTVGGVTTVPPVTQPVRTGATVVVANASNVGGSASAMTTALQGAGYTTGTPGDATGEDLATSVVYFAAGDAAAQAVATSVANDMGGLATAEMPVPPPFDGTLDGTVLVMLGNDTAGKTLADLNPPDAVTPPAAASVPTS